MAAHKHPKSALIEIASLAKLKLDAFEKWQVTRIQVTLKDAGMQKETNRLPAVALRLEVLTEKGDTQYVRLGVLWRSPYQDNEVKPYDDPPISSLYHKATVRFALENTKSSFRAAQHKSNTAQSSDKQRTIGEIIECLIKNNRQHYVFKTPDGSGRAFWVKTILEDLQTNGVVSDISELERFLGEQASGDNACGDFKILP